MLFIQQREWSSSVKKAPVFFCEVWLYCALFKIEILPENPENSEEACRNLL